MAKNDTNQTLEKTLWKATDKLRKNMDAAEYKHIVLGLIFLKYISDAFEEKYEQLRFDFANPKSEWYIQEERVRYEAMEDPDEDDDGIPFGEKTETLTTELREQMQEAGELDTEIKKQLAKIGIES